MSSVRAAQQALEWAEKKKAQLDRAQQLREERKANIVRAGEHQLGGGGGPSSQGYSGGG